MWEKLRQWLVDKTPYLLVSSMALVIIAINFPRGEWLIGWDNLSTELNVGMNISRNFSGVWQEYQGLGLLAGMAHMADLVRLIIQAGLSYLVPTMYLRSGMNLSMLLIGSVGVVNLVSKLFSSKKYVNWAASLAGIFYLLNIGTAQNFWAVFEPYAWAYGLVPWLISYFADFLSSGKKKSLVVFAIVSLLATPMAYLQTIFVVYCFVLFCLSLGYFIDIRGIGFKEKLKRITLTMTVVLGVNSFWLLPQTYFFVSSVGVTVNAKMNTIATPEVELSNQSMGSLFDVMKMEGYWLELHDVNEQGSFENLMKPWTQHLANREVQSLQYILVGLICVGLVGMYVFNYSWKWSLSLGTFAMIGLMQNYNAPFGLGWLGLYELFPIFGQIFRSSFTKVIVFENLLFSILFGVPLLILIDLSHKLFKKYYFVLVVILFTMLASSITYVGLPALKGEMSYKRMEQVLPIEYVALNSYFSKMEQGRILKLPASSLWGWQYNDWGYDGSGFLWYGIEQPILDRAFDVWSPYNETFYNQFSTALYGGNSSDVERVLKQYDVRYVLLDESVIAPGQGREILRIDETKKIAEDLGWSEKFHEGSLTVWDTNNTQIGEQFVSAPPSYSLVSGDTVKSRQDVVFNQVGTYVDEKAGVSYPFAQLMREELMGVEYGQDRVIIGSDPPTDESAGWTLSSGSDPVGRELIIPAWEVGDIVRIEYRNGEPIPAYTVNGLPGPTFRGIEKPELGKNHIVARVSEGSEWEEYLEQQTFEIGNNQPEVEVMGEPFVYDFAKDGQGSVGNCDVLKRGEASKNGSTYVTDQRGAACDYVIMQEIDPRLSYLMRVQGENMQGRSLKFFLYNTWSKRNDIEWLLKSSSTPVSQYSSGSHFDSTFSLLPWRSDGFYTLNIETRSFGQRAENRIDPIEVRWFPLKQIAASKVITNPKFSNSPIESGLRINEVKKTGTWLYRVKVEGSGLLKLSQGYDEGWIAPPLEHVKVDGWANGWMIKNSGEVTILYWPQLLEYLGFVLLGVKGWAIYKSKK